MCMKERLILHKVTHGSPAEAYIFLIKRYKINNRWYKGGVTEISATHAIDKWRTGAYGPNAS